MSFDVPPQEILTKDSVTVSVDAVVYYKVVQLKFFALPVSVVYYKAFRLVR